MASWWAWRRSIPGASHEDFEAATRPRWVFLWHPDYAPWIVGRHSLGANPNDRAFFDPNTSEIVWSSRDGMKDYEMEELAVRHLAGELVEMPQSESERDVENWFLKRGFKVEWI